MTLGCAASIDSRHTGLARLCLDSGAPFIALVTNGRAQPLATWNERRGQPLKGSETMLSLLEYWAHNAPLLDGAQLDDDALPLAACTVHAPLQPRQAFCTIANYRSGAIEAALDALPQASADAQAQRRAEVLDAIAQRRRHGAPYIVAKPISAVAGPHDDLALPPGLTQLDWEVEVGVVIGRPAYRIDPAEAMGCVAAYCTVNDLTLRDRVLRADPPGMGTDFLQAKGGPGWLPIGPLLVPAQQVADPGALRLSLRLNGVTMQQAEASDMIFDIAEQIAYLSQHVQLLPGDLLCTGSPAGFGLHHQRFLRVGDTLEAEVEGLGLQRTRVI